MKRLISILTFIVMFSTMFATAETYSANLSCLTSIELKTLQEDIDNTIDLYHDPDYDAEESVLEVTEEEVEAFFEAKDIDISWAWVNYTYTQEWDFYTLTTHIDYEDESGKYKPEVYSEIFDDNGDYVVYFLSVGKETIIDRRSELPENKWAETPESILNESSGIDLSQMSYEDLKTLNDEVEAEFSANHEPEYEIKDLFLSLTKVAVEDHLENDDTYVSWAWLDYEYTREWDLYTLTTPIDYDDIDDAVVYAEAYPFSGQYALCFLSIDDEVILDIRDQLPEQLFPEPDGNNNPNVEPTAIPDDNTNTPAPTVEPTSTPAPTATPEPILIQKGSKGDDVKQIQEYLIQLGYLDGTADGDFGNKTKSAVEAFQKAFSLEVTGIIDNDDMDMLLTAMDGLRQIQAQYEANRQEWIDSQFSIWDGSHNDLEELIKDVLNDERSYKHISTKYWDVSDEEAKLLLNETLKSLGNSNRLEVGDLFIIVEFSAKNSFNATIKSTAYGIASYANNTISLVAIE